MKIIVRCPVCTNIFNSDDYVFLDFLNTIYHQGCFYDLLNQPPMNDCGTFLEIVHKYVFFHELIIN